MAVKVEKPHGNGKYTKAGFWGMIRSALRQKSRWWEPIKVVKQAARRAYTGLNKRIRWEYQCAKCKNWFQEKDIEVDHIIDAGSLKDGDDLKGFVERLFCEADGLQVLCKAKCHKEKTEKARKNR